MNTPNSRRLSITWENTGTVDVYLGTQAPNQIKTTNAEVRVPAGGFKGINWFEDGFEKVTAEWSGVVASGTPTLVVFEGIEVGKEILELRKLLEKLLTLGKVRE